MEYARKISFVNSSILRGKRDPGSGLASTFLGLWPTPALYFQLVKSNVPNECAHPEHSLSG